MAKLNVLLKKIHTHTNIQKNPQTKQNKTTSRQHNRRRRGGESPSQGNPTRMLAKPSEASARILELLFTLRDSPSAGVAERATTFV